MCTNDLAYAQWNRTRRILFFSFLNDLNKVINLLEIQDFQFFYNHNFHKLVMKTIICMSSIFKS